MKAKVELIGVIKEDTSDNQTYVAHVRCDNREDGVALADRIDDRSSISGIEFDSFEFKPVCRFESNEAKISKDIFITLKYDEDYVTALGNIAYEINCLIQ